MWLIVHWFSSIYRNFLKMVAQFYSQLQQIVSFHRNPDLLTIDMDLKPNKLKTGYFSICAEYIWKITDYTFVPWKSSTTFSSRRATGYVKSRTILVVWVRQNRPDEVNISVNMKNKIIRNTTETIAVNIKCMFRKKKRVLQSWLNSANSSSEFCNVLKYTNLIKNKKRGLNKAREK